MLLQNTYLRWKFGVIQDESTVVIRGVFHHIIVYGRSVLIFYYRSDDGVTVPPAVFNGVGAVPR